jgi:acyl-CoA thioesterase-1
MIRFWVILTLFLSFTGSAKDKRKIVFIGDSLTEGYGVTKKYAFPSLVEAELKKIDPSYQVLNAGISGSTSASALSRVKWFVKVRPEVIILALGANDGLRGISPESTYDNLKKAIVHAQKKRIKVILGGMYVPKNYGPEYTKKFRNTFIKLKNELKLPFIPFMLEGVGGVPELNIEDGIHPNKKGHEIISKTVLKYLRPEL